MKNVTPDQRPNAIRARNARQAIAERFLAAAEQTPLPSADGPLAFPAFMSLASIRLSNDGSLNVSFNIPAEHANEVFLPMTAYCGHPLAVSVEVIDISEVDPLA